ncbi:MAG: SdrD B-like domain-containing protein, partial [Caldilineaceae bacterium]
EEGVPGVSATLYTTSTNAPVPDPNNPGLPLRTVTDADGRYLFANLPADGYFVQFDLASLPAGYHPSPQHAAGSNSIDSDADPSSGQTTPSGLLAAGDAHLSLDMGIWAPASLGDRVWFDLNANGLQEAGEPGAANVRVQLLDAQFAPTGQSVRTDANGRYLFDNLSLGRYAVQFDLTSLPAGHLPTLIGMGSDATRDSDADPQSGRTALTPVLTSGQLAWGLDMGVVGVVTVGDRVWLDANRNGIQDAGESGVPDIGVTLFNEDGEPAVDIFGGAVPPTTTAADGAYRFANLAPGAYFVQFELADLPPNYVVSAANMGANDALDSDASPSTGRSGVTNFLPGGFQDLTLDIGIHLPIGVRVGDFVWEDLDADGVQDWGEPGVAGVAVDLYVIDAQGQGVFTGQRVSTDAAGAYMFHELPPGQYYVVFDLATLPAGYKITAPNVGETGDGADVSNDSDVDLNYRSDPHHRRHPSNGQTAFSDGSIGKMPNWAVMPGWTVTPMARGDVLGVICADGGDR